MAKPRVLLLVNRWYADGGVENFLEQLIAETSEIIEYVICSLTTPADSDADCVKVGPVLKSGQVQDMFSQSAAIVAMMQEGDYDAVHIQASNGSTFFLAGLAKKAGIPRRIIHSHNAGAETSANPLKRMVGNACAAIWSGAPTELWACSSNAGEYLFGSRDFKVFYNGIDLDKFAFSHDKRICVRGELGVADDAFLLGSIGRISLQKNPLFQLRVFTELLKLMPNACFCMVGRGDLEDERDAEIERLGIVDKVVVVPRTSESDAFYSAFDALLFPPVFEGLSFVGIESQCSGVPVYASTAVPSELNVTDRITYMSLEDAPYVWAKQIADGIERFPLFERETYAKKMQDAGFERSECFKNIALAY